MGKFLSIDPLYRKFPSESNYSYAGNNPIFNIDKDGEKKTTYLTIVDQRNGAKTQIKIVTPGLLPLSTKDYYSGIRTWNWFDYSQNVDVNIDKNGKISMTTSEPSVGEYRTNTFFKSNWAAMEQAGENKVKEKGSFGGWIGTSKFGGGEDNAYAPNAGRGSKYVDYESMIKALGGTGALSKPFSKGLGAIKAANLEEGNADNPLKTLEDKGLIGGIKRKRQITVKIAVDI